MRVNLPDYRFYRTLDGYFIEAMTGKAATYWITPIVNNYANEDPYAFTLVPSATISEVVFSEEGTYIVKIWGSSEAQSQAKSYYIRHYPTLKSRLIPTVRNLICDCSSPAQTNCANGQYNVSQHARNDAYMAITSIISYKDIFSSPCFIKSTEFVLRMLLGETIDNYHDRIIGYLDYIDNYGYSPDTDKTMRELMSLIFVTAYYAEQSMVDFDYVADGATQGATDYNDGEVTAVDDLFDFSSLESCYYTRYGININEFLAKFDELFTGQSYACITGISEFLYNDVVVDEIIIPDPVPAPDPIIGGTTIILRFSPTSSSVVFLNGIVVPMTDFAYSGSTVTFKYELSTNDRVTVIK